MVLDHQVDLKSFDDQGVADELVVFAVKEPLAWESCCLFALRKMHLVKDWLTSSQCIGSVAQQGICQTVKKKKKKSPKKEENSQKGQLAVNDIQLCHDC